MGAVYNRSFTDIRDNDLDQFVPASRNFKIAVEDFHFQTYLRKGGPRQSDHRERQLAFHFYLWDYRNGWVARYTFVGLLGSKQASIHSRPPTSETIWAIDNDAWDPVVLKKAHKVFEFEGTAKFQVQGKGKLLAATLFLEKAVETLRFKFDAPSGFAATLPGVFWCDYFMQV